MRIDRQRPRQRDGVLHEAFHGVRAQIRGGDGGVPSVHVELQPQAAGRRLADLLELPVSPLDLDVPHPVRTGRGLLRPLLPGQRDRAPSHLEQLLLRLRHVILL